MDRYLQPEMRLKESDHSVEYKIKDIVGTGASCVVYYADSVDAYGIHTEYLLKEYNPRSLKLERGEDLHLRVCSESDSATFEAGLNRFRSGCQIQAEVRLSSDTKNSTSNIQSVFTTNGTCYCVMTIMAGETYEKVVEKSLHSLLQRIQAITKVVSNYHKSGLLHLDIKPDNIFSLPETAEMVQMFDFDSVIKKVNVSAEVFLSYTQSWAAPEQLLPNRRSRICEATDIFAIGEILFYKLMGRHSESHERRSFSTFTFDYSNKLFEGVNPQLFPLLEEIFKHTICNVVENRYQSTTELLEKLDQAIVLSNPHEPFLHHHLPSKAAFFIGRDAVLEEIENCLKHTDKLFISSIGGMGKSELAKQYAHAHKDDYDAVIFCVCSTDLESMILNDLPVANLRRYPEEKPRDYFIRKYRALSQLCNNQRVLIVVDNFNDVQDNALSKLLQLNCKILFTTRHDVAEYNYEQLHLGTLCEKHVWELFLKWYTRPLDAEDHAAVQQIFDLYQNHTMAVELIAKQMQASRVSPKQMLARLNEGGFSEGGRERVVHAKDGMNTKMNIHDHIRRLFDVSDLSEEQVYVLVNLSLIPPTGINATQFHDWCNLDSYEAINDLTESGWIREEDSNHISLHPVIADIMRDKLEQGFTLCDQMLQSLDEYIQDDEYTEWKKDDNQSFVNAVRHIVSHLSKLDSFSSVAIEFIDTVALELREFGDVSSYIPYLEKAIRVHEESSSSPDEITAMLHNTLGLLFIDDDKLQQAEAHLLQSLSIRMNDLPPNDAEIDTAYCNLGLLYDELGHFKRAKEYYLKALEVGLSSSEPSEYDLGVNYMNLGAVCNDLGEYQESENYLLTAQQMLQDACGENSLEVADVYDHLGGLYEDHDEYTKSLRYHMLALSIRTLILGEHHAAIARSYRNLSPLYEKTGDLVRAEEYCCRALQISKKLYGENHSETGFSYNNLGWHYTLRGEFDRAEPLLINAGLIFAKVYGSNHPATATAYNNLSMVYKDQGKIRKAKEYSEKALSINREIFGENHPEVAVNTNNLGTIYFGLKQYDLAEDYFTKALCIYQSHYGERHSGTSLSYKNLCLLYQETGELDKAIAACKRMISIETGLYGAEHINLAEPAHLLGSLYFSQKQFDKAAACFLNALEIWESKELHPCKESVVSCTNLAFSLSKQQEDELALCYFEKALTLSSLVAECDEEIKCKIRENIQRLKQ